MCGSCRNSPLPPTLKFQSRTSGSPRPTSIPSKRPWSGRARWWADTGCWPRRSWKCWRPLHQSPPSPRWSSWWFPDTSIISPHVIIFKRPFPTHSRRRLCVTEHTLFPWRLEVDGESKPDYPLFTATPRANGGREEGSSTWGGGKSVRSPLECPRTGSSFVPVTNVASL